MAARCKGAHVPQEIMLTAVRWSVAYPLSTRHVEELMRARGVPVDHATVNRWVITHSPPLEEAFRRRQRPVRVRWRMDGTSLKIKGEWHDLDRAVEKQGQTIDVLRTEHRDTEAARRFLKNAIRRHGAPETMTIDGSGAKEAAITRDHKARGAHVMIRRVKYFNNVVGQDHRAVTRVTRPMSGFQSFGAAQGTLTGIELRHRLRKGPWEPGVEQGFAPAQPFDALAASSPTQQGPPRSYSKFATHPTPAA